MAESDLTLTGEMSRLYDAVAMLIGAGNMIEHDDHPDVHRLVRMAKDLIEQSINNIDEIELKHRMAIKAACAAPWDGHKATDLQ